MKRLAASLAILIGASASAAEHPVDLGLLPRGEIVSGIAALSDAEQTYELYLPTAFSLERRWPILFLFDPRARGRFAAELFRPAAEELGWILLSSNNTRSDGPGEPNQRAVNALFPDAFRRLPLDERRVYAGGFSGGAVISWSIGLVSRGLAGVISVGGRPEPAHAALLPAFALFATAGELDFNYQPSRELIAIAAKAGAPHRLEFFPGPHAWCPPDTARRALLWLETIAMRDGLAPRDEALLGLALDSDRARVGELETSGSTVAAARLLEEMAATYRGLAATGRFEERAKELLRLPQAKSELAAESDAALYEARGSRRIGDALLLLDDDSQVPVAKLRQLLALPDALRRTARSRPESNSGERYLAAVAIHLGSYRAAELMGRSSYRAALPALEVAVEARPASPGLRYNLACARARLGDVEGAMASLRSARELDLPDPRQALVDPDLVALRDRADFRKLFESAPPPP